MGEINRRTMKKWVSAVSGAGLLGAVAVGAPAQEAQRQENRQQRQQDFQRQQRFQMRPNMMMPDEVVEDMLVVRLAERSNLTPFVKITVRDGVATISGKVPSEAAERRALGIAGSTTGVTSVRDQISVDPSIGKGRSERNLSQGELARQVAQRIAKNIEGAKAGEDWWFDGWRVEGPYNRWNVVIESDEPGRVTIDGDVPSLNLMRKVIESAANTPGVTGLESDLELERPYYDYGYPYRYPYLDYGYPYL